ncbi:MAG: Mut7-C RNAse domain-containing protein [bacterium]|nr:Mut7-C RNAse domain-containing protein [bacterium]
MKFIADFMCCRLGRWLRLFGYDVIIYKEPSRKKLILLSLKELRTIITRDSKLSNKAYSIIKLKSTDFREQLKEIKNYGIKIETNMLYSRCSICNGEIIDINKDDVYGKVPPYVYETNNEFYSCKECKKIYWSGSHRKLIEKELQNLI